MLLHFDIDYYIFYKKKEHHCFWSILPDLDIVTKVQSLYLNAVYYLSHDMRSWFTYNVNLESAKTINTSKLNCAREC